MLRLFLILILASAATALTARAAQELSPEDAARCAHLQRQLAALEDRLERQDGRAAH